MGIMAFAVPPGADPDPCWGFLVMHGMEQGNHFNLLITPDPANIAINQSSFLSWWSPGQYLLPYLFKTLLKVDTGHAISLTVISCSLIGLGGFYMLFKHLGFTKWLAAISVAFIATQLFFIMPFVYYTGGEVLLFAFMGWFLYGCFYFKKIRWPVLVFVFLGLLIGFFSKSSVLWMYVAGIACVWMNVSINETLQLQSAINYNPIGWPGFKKRFKIWLLNGMLLAVPFICAFAIIYIFYLSKGPNPATGTGILLVKPETFGFPLASPMLSAFSIDELFNGLIYQPDRPTISYHWAILILFILVFFSLLFILLISRFSPGKKYLTAIITLYIFGVVFFSYMFLKQAAISYEGRHFRIIGLLAIPGIVYLFFRSKVGRVLFFIIWIVFIYIGFIFFKGEFKANKQASRGNSGISQQLYDEATMREITTIDRAHKDAIFVVMSSDIAAEINNNRVITVDTESITDSDGSKLRYTGKSGPIYILMPGEYVTNGMKEGIINSFTGYHKFAFKQLSPDYYLYYASN